MNKQLMDEYQEWGDLVQKKLTNDRNWIAQYTDYAKNMLKLKDAFVAARSRFRVFSPLHAYLTIGETSAEIKTKKRAFHFDLRYLGQSVGTVIVKNSGVTLTVSSDQAKRNEDYFGCKIGGINSVAWNSNRAKEFRHFFRYDCQGLPRQKEHMVESALFSEIEKVNSNNKTLCYMTPVSYAKTRIHMKTAVKASESKNGILSVTKTGGEIDLLCRRSIKSGRGESRLVVVEIKDENKKSESFDMAIKQAITYSVFLRELIYSDAGEYWMEIWGMKNQKKSEFIIDCAVAMPKGQTEANFANGRLKFMNEDGTIDAIELHFIELTDRDSENVSFNHSFSRSI